MLEFQLKSVEEESDKEDEKICNHCYKPAQNSLIFISILRLLFLFSAVRLFCLLRSLRSVRSVPFATFSSLLRSFVSFVRSVRSLARSFLQVFFRVQRMSSLCQIDCNQILLQASFAASDIQLSSLACQIFNAHKRVVGGVINDF